MFYKLLIGVFFYLGVVNLSPAFQGAVLQPFSSGRPSAEQSQKKVIDITRVDGRLVAPFDLVTRKGTLSVSLYIDLASPNGLSLDEDVFQELGLNAGKGFVTVKSPGGFSAFVHGKTIVELASNQHLARISALFIKKLDGRPIVGRIGLGLLGKFHVSFDVTKGKVILSASRPAGLDTAKIPADVVVAISRVGDRGIILPISGMEQAELNLSTGQYDTLIDGSWAASAGYPAGNIPNVTLKGQRTGTVLDLSQMLAFRPDDFNNKNTAVKVISGINLFLNNIVDIDLVNKTVAFTTLGVSEYPKKDLAFFSAMVSDDDTRILAYLDQYPTSRLAPDAANLLLDRRIGKAASDRDILEAAKFVRDTALSGYRGGVCLDLMDRLKTLFPARRSLSVAVGRMGVEVARHDSDPKTLYRLHKMIGLEQLEAGNIREAWKGLLSSAFGLPRDPTVNYALGRVYEQQKRLKRAQSRYQRALELLSEGSARDKKRQKMFRQTLDRVDNMLRSSRGATNG